MAVVPTTGDATWGESGVRIAIIGAGHVGTAVARAAIETGNDVTLTGADSAKARRVAAQIGATAAEHNAEAVEEADIAVLAVPFTAVDSVAQEIRDAAAGKIVIDATNPIEASRPTDRSGLEIGELSAAEELQQLLPDTAVVKAFNTVLADKQAQPITDEGIVLDGLYAGNNESAKRTVADWLSAIGYRPIDAGDLSAARDLEHMAFINISLNARNHWSWQTGWKLVGPTR
jgi:8-hydroxy-5-deazaflavin:NADPH oxidoreductase